MYVKYVFTYSNIKFKTKTFHRIIKKKNNNNIEFNVFDIKISSILNIKYEFHMTIKYINKRKQNRIKSNQISHKQREQKYFFKKVTLERQTDNNVCDSVCRGLKTKITLR